MMNTIVMTGGTSGLGEVAARRFFQAPNTRLLRGARRGGPLGAETLPLDLMRLENVRSFASAVDRELGPAQINSLVLNGVKSGSQNAITIRPSSKNSGRCAMHRRRNMQRR
jgi:NAD(P)-dependent dehydrogenase (short-subunit alcohol dehydrogenase family)